jgi:hypothetical protein
VQLGEVEPKTKSTWRCEISNRSSSQRNIGQARQTPNPPVRSCRRKEARLTLGTLARTTASTENTDRKHRGKNVQPPTAEAFQVLSRRCAPKVTAEIFGKIDAVPLQIHPDSSSRGLCTFTRETWPDSHQNQS